jgi:hypothetical protein
MPTTLFIDRHYKWGLGGPWEVTDGATRLATGDDPVSHRRLPRMDIEVGGRRFTARERDGANGYEVSDAATGEQLVDLRFTEYVHSGRGRREVAAVDLASTGATLSWNHLPAQRQLGFYETTGAPVMTIGHRLDLRPSAGHGVARTLLRFWGSTLKGADRYQAQVTDEAVGRLVATEDLPILALLGMHLERTFDRRHGAVGT